MTRRSIEIGMAVSAATFLISVPWLIPALTDNFWVSVITEILIWSLFAASANLLFGYVGLLSFGQALYFGFGMYGVALGIDHLGLSFWPAFGLGIVSGASRPTCPHSGPCPTSFWFKPPQPAASV